MQQEKGTKKGTFLARRYYRAALLSLFAFFEGVLNNWIKTIIQERQEFAGVERQDTLKKCDAMVEYCFFCSYTKRPGTFCSLYGYINRYEQHDLASSSTSTARPWGGSRRPWKSSSVMSKP